MKIIAMKLVSGEEIIARFVDASPTRNGVTVSHARVIGLQQAPNGDFGIGLMDYILSDKDCAIEINNSAIITSFEPSREVERAYLSNTSGFQLS